MHTESFEACFNLLYSNYIIFYFLQKFPVNPFQKIKSTHNTAPLWNQNFLIHHKAFYQNFSPLSPLFWKMRCMPRHGFCHPPSPPPHYYVGLHLNVCQNFLEAKVFLKFVGDKILWGELKLYGGSNIYYYTFIISFL